MSFDPFAQFKIQSIIPLSIFGFDISITNSTISVMLVSLIAYFFYKIMSKNTSIYPNKIQIFGEMIFNFVRQIVRDNLSDQGLRFMPFFFTIFLFVLFGNLVGMIPGNFAFTSHIIATFVLSSIVILATIVIGIQKQGIKFLSIFAPSAVPKPLLILVTPIEIFSFLNRTISLSLRLFANVVAGHVMLEVLFYFVHSANGIGGIVGAIFSLFASLILMGYEIFIAFIQAYIFTMLSCVYMKDALSAEH